jgi:hypothetical protein
MDLRWQRQTELWLRLIGQAPARGARLQLEAYRSRALLTLSCPQAEHVRADRLLRLLGLLRPEATDGLPVRAWAGQGRLWLSVAMPVETAAEGWFAMTRRLETLLDRATRDGHGNRQ